ncbi:MAG: lipoprotein [Polaromonas sp.]|nr:lipoprotein [Polaromonas sp.]
MPFLLVLFGLSACGQKGPLFLAPQSVPYKLLPSSPASGPVASPAPAIPASAAK